MFRALALTLRRACMRSHATKAGKAPSRSAKKKSASSKAVPEMLDLEPAEQLPPGESFFEPGAKAPIHNELMKQVEQFRQMDEASPPTVDVLTVRKEAETRLLRGHPWIYANDVIESLPSFSPGQMVHVQNKLGQAIGTAYVNPRSLVAARLVSRRIEQALDNVFFFRKFERALQLRTRFLGEAQARYCRLVHGEGDGVPGLVVDRYGDAVVVQAHTLGIDRHLPAAVAALQQLLNPRLIVERSDTSAREHEGLPGRVRVLVGDESQTVVDVEENGVRYSVDLLNGQKTGFYYDQREARRVVQDLVQRLSHSKFRFLDLYCYAGSFALNAARAGAPFTFGVDASPGAVAAAQTNAQLNGLQHVTHWKKADVESVLAGMAQGGETYDMVVCDPPALVRSSKKKFAGLRKMRQVHEAAMRVTGRGGVLVCSSCDHLVPPHEFSDVLTEAAERAGRTAQIVWRGFAGADHPVPLGAPEPDYLCTFVLRLQ